MIFRDLVESGQIDVGDRPTQEILDEFWAHLDEFLTDMKAMVANEEDNLHLELDYRGTLLSYARQEANIGHDEIAVTFYALWIEHTVNGCLIRGLQRKGYGPEIIKPLLREYNIKTKITALWHVGELSATIR
jgi:hypothetical protein